MVEADARTPEPRYLTSISGLIESVDAKNAAVNVQQFSDSIILSASYSQENAVALIGELKKIQMQFSLAGIFLRGAVAFGKHYVSQRVMYSDALIVAYRLEQQAARYPRIVLDHNLMAILVHHPAAEQTKVNSLVSQLLKDRDGYAFVNYLEPKLFEEHAKRIRQGLEQGRGSPSILEKYVWLADYQNYLERLTGAPETEFGIAGMANFAVS